MGHTEKTDPALTLMHFPPRADDEEDGLTQAAQQILVEVAAIRAELGAIQVQLGEIRGANLDGKICDIEARVRVLETSRAQSEHLPQTVRALEGWRMWAVGVVAAFGVIGGVVAIILNTINTFRGG